MTEVYDFFAGPALWTAFLICIGGMGLRVAYLCGLSKERDRELYSHAGLGSALQSICHWLIPLGSVSFRTQPLFGIAFFIFHACLLGIPFFLLAHNTLFQEAFGIGLPTLPDSVADMLTVVFLIAMFFLFLRRMMRPEVRILTTAGDIIVLLMTALPFVTGYLAYHQIGPYRLMLVAHMISAEVLLICIPFSKLGHCVLFFFSRACIGVEFGYRRGARTW